MLPIGCPPQLLAYRRGDFDAAGALASVPSPMRSLILHMIQRSPGALLDKLILGGPAFGSLSTLASRTGDRLSAEAYLQEWGGRLFPAYFDTHLHPLVDELAPLNADARVHILQRHFDELQEAVGVPSAAMHHSPTDLVPAAAVPGLVQPAGPAAGGQQAAGSQQSINNLLEDVVRLKGHLQEIDGRIGKAVTAVKTLADGLADTEKGASSSGQGRDAKAMLHTDAVSSAASEGMVLVTALLCSLLRGAQQQEHKTRAIVLLSRGAMFCDDETRHQRIVPYLVVHFISYIPVKYCSHLNLSLAQAMAADRMVNVRCTALAALAQVLAAVRTLPPSDAKLFNECVWGSHIASIGPKPTPMRLLQYRYILPSLSLVPNDKEERVRVAYAGVIAPLAAAAHRLLQGLQSDEASTLRYEAEVQQLRAAVQKVVHELVVGPHSAPAARRALLPHLATLAGFLGHRSDVSERKMNEY